MTKQQLAKIIWEGANNLRSKMEASEYKDYMLGFIFYNFLSQKELEYLKKQQWSDDEIKALKDDDEYGQDIKNTLGYVISYENLFSTWVELGKDLKISNVIDALNSFEDKNIAENKKEVFGGIFDTLRSGIISLGKTATDQSTAIQKIISLIKQIPISSKDGYDTLGFVYEYLISMFAANAGKKAGEFYTPHEVSLLMSQIVAEHLKNRDTIKIYDPTSGSGSLLINIGKAFMAHNKDKNRISYYAQELRVNTFNLTRMNLIMRDVLADNIFVKNADTLKDDWPEMIDRNGEPFRMDAVVSNPPYSQKWEIIDGKTAADPRFSYGVAPKTKADYAFLLHDLSHTANDGIVTIILPHGVLFRGGSEAEIRKNLILNNHIDTIIGLPPNIFYGTGIPTIIMVLKRRSVDTKNDILFIDAKDGFEKVGKNNRLRPRDIKKITDTIKERKSLPGYSYLAPLDEIKANEYNLNIPRYISPINDEISDDLYASINGGIPNYQLEALSEFWSEFSELRSEAFSLINKNYSTLKLSSDELREHRDIAKFKEHYAKHFTSFEGFLKENLIENQPTNPTALLDLASIKLKETFDDIRLIDYYDAFGVLDSGFQGICADIELLSQIESSEKIAQIIPLEIISNLYLQDELNEISNLNSELSKLSSDFDEMIEGLELEDKEQIFSDDKLDSKALKSLASDKTSVFYKLFENKENQKALDKKIKQTQIELDTKALKTLDNLNQADTKKCLEIKWIEPIIKGILALCDDKMGEFISKILNLNERYKDTLKDLDSKIKVLSDELVADIENLKCDNENDQEALNELMALLKGSL
ncbi:type I restriction-modification system, M subunit [Campylobacter hyointestinalis]|uniref:type I restriction-modification system subunit M n=1 Tax=Campylobacter hyointestinalis TaxID=198 RepID=UPI0008EF1A0A|nr:type I restriction-modification system subunit M [Campylobacter hyointestinalis]QKF56440.1 type I restriction/modification system, methylation subunit [Campylobacter hyointestinalis subsp. hyointestinalis]TXK46535.1 type I restriction-modification system subunit M [Campylobacter hyointestinalis]SFT42970.1 type I restriction enzyme M protein [Campylobacter hyointestinalis]SUW91244.1 type I restriction-modification system, M subunit [Campylobacter hyointestinalis]